MKDLLPPLLKRLTEQKISILCGAGISYNSGLPVVHQFIDAILNKFELGPKEKMAIHSSEFPFEAFIEMLQVECETDELLKIFKKGKYNTNHLFLANLIKNKALKNVVTTNFDEHIENACIEIGLKESIDYKVYRKEQEYKNIEWENDIVNIIKIHGCASDLSSMAINMKMVASKTDSLNKIKVINRLFNQKLNPVVLILGYSCSDVFDISPIIEKINDCHSQVLLLEHIGEDEIHKIEDLNIRSNKNPFKHFKTGKRIFFPADKFIETAWKNFGYNNYYLINYNNVDWQTSINDWYNYVVETNTIAFKHHICSRLFYNIGYYEFSEKHYNQGISIAYELHNYTTAASEIGNLGLNYNTLGKYDEAKKCMITSLDIYRRLGNVEGEIIRLQSLGNIYRNEGNYPLAEESIISSITLAQVNGKQRSICNGLGNLALIYNLTKQYRKAIEAAEKGLLISHQLGIKQSEGSQLATLAMAYYNIGEVQKSINLFIESIKITQQIKDRNNESGALTNLAAIYTEEGEFQKSLSCLAEALSICLELKTLQTEGLIYFNMGRNRLLMGEIGSALSNFHLALNLFTDIYPEDHPHLSLTKKMVQDLSK